MSEAAQPEPSPAERFYAGLKQVLTVSKKEILRREAEYRERRKQAKAKRAA